MNRSPRVDLVLRDYFADDGISAPDHVLEWVEERIEHQPQRRAWRVSWRDSHVSSYLKYAAAVAAVIAIAGVFVLARPGEPSVGGPLVSPATSGLPSDVPSSSSGVGDDTWWQTGADCGTCRGGLQAGTYTTSAFEPPLTYTVPVGWVNSYDGPDGVALLPDTPGNRTHMASDSPTLHDLTVVRSVGVEIGACAGSGGDRTATVADVVESIVARAGLDVTEPVSVGFGGLSGMQIDVGLAPDWTTPCRAGEDTPSAALFTFEDSGGLQTASPGERYRLIFLDVPAASGGGVMVIDVYAQDGDIADLAQAAAPIIESFDFDLGAAPSPS